MCRCRMVLLLLEHFLASSVLPPSTARSLTRLPHNAPGREGTTPF